MYISITSAYASIYLVSLAASEILPTSISSTTVFISHVYVWQIPWTKCSTRMLTLIFAHAHLHQFCDGTLELVQLLGSSHNNRVRKHLQVGCPVRWSAACTMSPHRTHPSKQILLAHATQRLEYQAWVCVVDLTVLDFLEQIWLVDQGSLG